MCRLTLIRVAVCTTVFLATAGLNADEGMWLFNKPPTRMLKEKYGFEPTADWLEHIQKSCVRFGRGGSASIISANGLVMTNHHVGRGQMQKLSTKERDLLDTGFYASSFDEELKCSDLEVSVLWKIDDVTERIRSVETDAMSPAEANTARQKQIANIVAEAEKDSELKCEVVTLYHGARYHLYSYKRYTDIRLVMAPDGDIAHFGGDTDNFEYPRYCLDVAFFRIYEDGKPFKTKHYLKWSKTGASEGDLVFIAGHPGRTRRQNTVDHLKYLRDVSYPSALAAMWRREVQLQTFVARSDHNAQIAGSDLSGVQNGRKAITGYLKGLHDPQILRDKIAAETELRRTISTNPEYRDKWGDPWTRIRMAYGGLRGFRDRYNALEGGDAGGRSSLMRIARTLVRLAQELPKPNEDRLREYRDSSLDGVYRRLYSSAPIYDALEINRLESGLSYLAEKFGGDDPLVTSVLANKSPRARAAELVLGTMLKDIETRKRLVEGGADAIAASTDPLIRLAYDLDPQARALRTRYEDEVEGEELSAYADIAAARFAVHGETFYPDATGSLRLALGTVGGFEEDGKQIPAFTNIAGLYERHELRHGVEPFELPQRWIKHKGDLDMDTPFNFISTADVIGGNSGSPTLNRRGEVVGIVFDINLYGLVWSTAYTDKQARTVHVDSRAIVEALRKVYNAKALADEIVGR